MEFLDTIQQRLAVFLRQEHDYPVSIEPASEPIKKYAFLRIAFAPGMNHKGSAIVEPQTISSPPP